MSSLRPNDQLAWNEFVEYYSGFIEMLLHKMTIPTQIHDDLKQEVLIKIWKALQGYESRESAKFRTWLGTVIRHAILEYMRAYRKRENRELEFNIADLEQEGEERSRIDELINDEWVNYMVKHVVEHLRQFCSAKAIDVFLLIFKGLKTQEISEQLDIPANTVYVLRNRVKDRLLNEMNNLRQVLEF